MFGPAQVERRTCPVLLKRQPMHALQILNFDLPQAVPFVLHEPQ